MCHRRNGGGEVAVAVNGKLRNGIIHENSYQEASSEDDKSRLEHEELAVSCTNEEYDFGFKNAPYKGTSADVALNNQEVRHTKGFSAKASTEDYKNVK